MGEIKFSPEQRAVIEARDCSLLVSAAAGSGKTAVLVQRVLEKLTDPTHPQDINRLLIVTFTNAAAAQMKERLGKRLSELLRLPEYAGNRHLEKQALLLRNAPIQTIHGFCLSLLREFFYELGLDPSFRIAEEAEIILMQADIMEKMTEAHYEAGDELFLRLSECVGKGNNDEKLIQEIQKLYKFSQSAPFPERWTERAVCRYRTIMESGEIPQDDPCFLEAVSQIKKRISGVETACRRALAICREPYGPVWYAEALEDDLAFVTALLAAEDYHAMAIVLASHEKLAMLSRKKSPEESEEKKGLVKAIRDAYKKEIETVRNKYFFEIPEQMQKDQTAMAPLMIKLLELTEEYSAQIAAAKAEKGILDFSDLEHFAVRLLVRETKDGYEPTEIAAVIRKRFDELMMDECQDNNEIQDLLMWSISGETEGHPNRFMVGDVKQSIYKFRMAKPELFMKKYEEYGTDGDFRKIVLGRNYRSRSSVVDYVNQVFSCLMHKEFGGIEYDDDAKLYCHAGYAPDTADHRTELLVTFTSQTDEENEDDRLIGEEVLAAEAYTLGGRIRRLISEGFPISDGEEINDRGEKVPRFRPAKYGDVTVLFRSMSACAETFAEAFAELGIPTVTETQNGFFSAQEVAVTLNALRVIDNPRPDIPLVSVLRSEMCGLSGEELAVIRITTEPVKRRYRLSFYEAVTKFLETDLSQISEEKVRETAQNAKEKLVRFRNIISELREIAGFRGVAEVIRELFEKTGYLEYCRVKPGGERRCDNLNMLTEKARAFEKTSYSGIFDFVRYVDRLVKYETEAGEAQTGAGTDAVHFMSIHKSKGLEAPIVCVAALSKKINQTDSREEIVSHAELGIGMKYRDEQTREEAHTLFRNVIAQRSKTDTVAEELRVLYVAMTRAKEKLILSGTEKDRATFESKSELLRTQTAGYLDLATGTSYMGLLYRTYADSIEHELLQVSFGEQNEEQAEEAAMREETERAGRRQRMERLLSVGEEACLLPENEELRREINLRECFVYPYPKRSRKRKLSVSELKKAAYELETQEELFPEQEPLRHVPEFLKERYEQDDEISTAEETQIKRETESPEKPKTVRSESEKKPETMSSKTVQISGSERGTLYHRIMECFDFTKDCESEAAITEELRRLVSRKLVREDVLQLVSVGKLMRFFSSELAKRMKLAARKDLLQREKPFVIGIPYDEIYGTEETRTDLAETETEYVMVQGVIDVCFEEEGKMILADYKTDYVSGSAKEELSKRYRTQLDYYERALKTITKMPVKERIIYAFSTGEEFAV